MVILDLKKIKIFSVKKRNKINNYLILILISKN